MAKLIGHYFNAKAKQAYSTFEVDGLKESDRQYRKVKGETQDGTPQASYEYWSVMRKDELGKLRQPGFGTFTMYGVSENMPRFKELVIAALSDRVRSQKEGYESAVELLKIAETS